MERIKNISLAVRELSESTSAWTSFLDTVSRFPEFSFYENIAINKKIKTASFNSDVPSEKEKEQLYLIISDKYAIPALTLSRTLNYIAAESAHMNLGIAVRGTELENEDNAAYLTFLKSSINYILSKRCGIEPQLPENAFKCLYKLNTYPKLSALGNAVVELSRPILFDIEETLEKIRNERYYEKGSEQMDESKKDRLKEITDGLEKGIKDLFASGKYAEYLKTMANFHNYSFNNVLLIHSQKPDATHVAGYNKWKDKFKRYVKKGEKGIQILAPVIYKKKSEEVKTDPETGAPLLDENGKAIIEEKEVKAAKFRVVSVFDVSQTDGKPLPQLTSDLKGDVKHFDEFVEALKRSSPVPIEFKPMRESMDGYFSFDEQKIAIRDGMSEVQTVSAMVHEMAHSILHNKSYQEEKYEVVEVLGQRALYVEDRIDRDTLPSGLFRYDLRGSDDDPGIPISVERSVMVNYVASIITAQEISMEDAEYLSLNDSLGFTGEAKSIKEFYLEMYPEKENVSRATEEVQAESVSFAVCAYYGIETGENSFGYIASWSKDKDLKELKSSLDVISKTSNKLITDIDESFRDICKERGIDVTKDSENTVKEKSEIDDPDYYEQQKESERLERNGDPDYYHIFISDETKKIEDYEKEHPDWHKIWGSDAQGFNGDSFAIYRSADDLPAWLRDYARQQEAVKSANDMPDPSITINDMISFGYLKEDMLPVSKEKAAELMAQDVTVYALFPDNTESMLFDWSEIKESDAKLFGITKDDWQALKKTLQKNDPEKAFLESMENSYVIYQLKDDASRELKFSTLTETGIPNKDNYKAVYSGKIESSTDKNTILENLFTEFNINHPKDFRGHSMSVSDVVALKIESKVTYHFVDDIGFKELSDFNTKAQTNEIKKQPQSILSKLKAPVVRQEKPKAPSKSAEMEI